MGFVQPFRFILGNQVFWRVERRMRRIRAQIEEEWLLTAFINKGHRLVKINILAEALARHPLVITNNIHVEMLARPLLIGRGPIEAALMRRIARAVAQVPFTNPAGLVAGALQNLRQRHRFLKKVLARFERVRDAVAKFMHAGQQRRTGRRTGRTDIKMIEAHTFIMHAIQIRCLQNRMAVATDIPITLIIGQNENNVWLLNGDIARNGRQTATDRRQ